MGKRSSNEVELINVTKELEDKYNYLLEFMSGTNYPLPDIRDALVTVSDKLSELNINVLALVDNIRSETIKRKLETKEFGEMVRYIDGLITKIQSVLNVSSSLCMLSDNSEAVRLCITALFQGAGFSGISIIKDLTLLTKNIILPLITSTK
ncbi:MAG: hypothetical protein ACP5NY_01885 [Thermocladium sp.]